MTWRAWIGKLGRGLRAPALVLVALLLAFEEWGWRPLVAWAARAAAWAPLAALEQRLRALPPRWAFAAFALPALLLFPVKLLALWAIHRGHAVLGVLVIVLAKLLGTALLGRIFVVTEAQLLEIAWFARALAWWRDLKQRLGAALARQPAWRAAQAWRHGMRRAWRRWSRAPR